MIPERSLTRVAAVTLPASFMDSPAFTDQTSYYVQKIFSQVGNRYDLRLCLKGVTPHDLISNVEVFEDLDFRAAIPLEESHDITLTISKDTRLDGLLVWLSLWTADDVVIDILEHRHCWLPVFLPAFGSGISVSAGSRISARIERTLCENRRNPDYRIVGQVELADGTCQPFSYTSSHIGQGYRQTPFYDRLFAEDRIPTLSRAVKGAELRAQLQSVLPEFMIPTAFVPIAALPRTPNGKIDRQQLASRAVAAPLAVEVFAPPRSALEQQLVAIWRAVLVVDRVGINDNFFDLGGHSLRMAQVHARLRELLGREVPLLALFQYPTISALAGFLQGEQDPNLQSDSQERGRLRKDAAAMQRQRAQGRKKRDE